MGPAGPWTIARASCQGVKNAARGKSCQDSAIAVRIPKLPGCPDALVAAVADGLGSAQRSRSGARRACRSAAERAVHLIWSTRPTKPSQMETVLNAAVLQARLDIERMAQQDGRPVDQYATTLLLLVHLHGHAATIHIGDGAAVIKAGKRTTTLSRPERGEFANETTPITAARALQKARIDIARPGSGVSHIALMTDGIMEVSLDSQTAEPHLPFFEPLFDWLDNRDEHQTHPSAELAELLKSDTVTKRTHDDTTLLLARREPT